MAFTATVTTVGHSTITTSVDTYENAIVWLSRNTGDFYQLNSFTGKYNMPAVDTVVLLMAIDRVRHNS